MNRTSNYKLCQWEAEDKVRRTDFNEDNAKIDAALAAVRDGVNSLTAAVHKVAAGYYIGDGEETRSISLGFTPIAVYVCSRTGSTYYRSNISYYCYGGLAVTGGPLSVQGMEALAIEDGGFRVSDKRDWSQPSVKTYDVCTNAEGTRFHYIAIG